MSEIENVCLEELIMSRKRKRLRRAIDPCLGYYESPSVVTERETNVPSSRPATRSKPLLPVTSHPPPAWIPRKMQGEDQLPSGEDTNLIPPIACLRNDGGDSPPGSPMYTSSTRAMRRPRKYDGLRNRVVLSSEDHQEAESDVERSSPITVDAFLRKAMRRPKRNGLRNRVILSSEDHTAAPQTSKSEEARSRRKRQRQRRHEVDSDYQPSSHETSPRLASPRRKLPKAPFTKRLVTAAIMSLVHPIDSLVTGTAPDGRQSQRRPLRFEPARSVSPPPPNSTWSLTDPRKTDPFRDSSFATGGPMHDSSLAAPRKPLSAWQTPWNQIPSRPDDAKHKLQRRSSTIPQGSEVRRMVCPPLVFVPLAEAEAMYASSRR
ncbi:hypothetical protein CCMSSC00406_0001966 [Pleurotus cornucopiae]|uniref:Uncharacterized protein n=1 Tax=Pleurotus cornucopiae TaxID=5321 RepID=A0ACB7J4V8_PLECO|nr:hypothetical protein CCMSSC00406_0001966 [Pleurotus cornucopiae]